MAGLAYLSGLAEPGSFGAIPSYWTQAAGWLNAHAGNQAVLVEPGAPFGQYLWGSPLDDVLSPLTSADYAGGTCPTSARPATSGCSTTIDQRLAAGDGSAGLTDLLARMGVKYVVVRNDLDRSALNGAWPARIHQALAESPGVTKVAQFGTFVGSFAPDNAVSHFDAPYPPVEIYQVAGAEPAATVAAGRGHAAGLRRPRVAPHARRREPAGPGREFWGLGSRPVLLNDDGAGQPVAGSVVSDSLRRRVRSFGTIRALVLADADRHPARGDVRGGRRLHRARLDQVPERGPLHRHRGRDRVVLGVRRGGDPRPSGPAGGCRTPRWTGTCSPRWESGSWTGPVGQWIQLKFDAAVDPRTINVAFDASFASGPPVTQVRISTAAGEATDAVAVTSSMQPLRVPPGPTGWLRITVTGLALRPVPPTGAQVGIYDIAVPGVQAARTIVAPAVPGPDPSAVVLAKARAAALRVHAHLDALGLLAPAGRLHRGAVRPRSHLLRDLGRTGRACTVRRSSSTPPLADQFMRLSPDEPQVTASSVVHRRIRRIRPMAAFDGNPATSWVASRVRPAPHAAHPVGRPAHGEPADHRAAAGRLRFLQVQLTGSGGQRRGAWVSRSGWCGSRRCGRARSTITFIPTYSPVQVTGVDIPGVPQVGTPSGTFRLPCGLGPSLTVNGQAVATSVTGSFASLLTERPVQFTACSPVRLAAGANRLVEPASRRVLDPGRGGPGHGRRRLLGRGVPGRAAASCSGRRPRGRCASAPPRAPTWSSTRTSMPAGRRSSAAGR